MVAITAGLARTARPTFYVWMAGLFVLIAFGGFTPTYWAKLAGGSAHFDPIVHVHGALLFTWTLFYLSQTWRVAVGRMSEHREWGVAGVALVTAMCISMVLMAIHSMKADDAVGRGDAGRSFAILGLTGSVIIGGLVAAAIANVRRPEAHKRLMILAMLPPMHAALARVFLALFAPPGAAGAGPPPVFVAVPPGLAACLLLVPAMIYDWRTRGRPHPVYLVGLPVFLLYVLSLVPISSTPQWVAFARGVEGLMG